MTTHLITVTLTLTHQQKITTRLVASKKYDFTGGGTIWDTDAVPHSLWFSPNCREFDADYSSTGALTITYTPQNPQNLNGNSGGTQIITYEFDVPQSEYKGKVTQKTLVLHKKDKEHIKATTLSMRRRKKDVTFTYGDVYLAHLPWYKAIQTEYSEYKEQQNRKQVRDEHEYTRKRMRQELDEVIEQQNKLQEKRQKIEQALSAVDYLLDQDNGTING